MIVIWQVSDRDDAELVTSIGAGDRESERMLCQRYARRIRLYGLRHLRDEDAAADLVQQVLLVVLEAIRAGKVDEPSRLASFVLGTCRFVVWDLRRGERRRQEVAEQASAGELLARDPDWHRVDLPRLYGCLGRLPTRELTVIRLTFHEDRSAEEVGAVLSLQPGHVRVIRHRALQHLTDCVEGRAA
jgi:RNA polymerase sigma-70 factor (ECF subfamily)